MFFRYNLPALLWALFILFITLIPGQYIPPASIWDFASFDKVVHFGVFAILIVLLALGFIKQYRFNIFRSKAITIAFSISIPYGIFLEMIQGLWLDDRYFDVYDVIANAIGCILGIIIFKFVRHKLQL